MTTESLGQLELEAIEALEDLHYAMSIQNPNRRTRRIASVKTELINIRDRARFADCEDEIDRLIEDHGITL